MSYVSPFMGTRIADGMYGDSPFTPRQLPSGGPGVIDMQT